MVQSLLPSRPALHLCHSLLKRTASSPTLQMCSSHRQASYQAHTLTYLVSAFHQASWVGCERCLEGPDHNFVLASSKQVMLYHTARRLCMGLQFTQKNVANKCCHSVFHLRNKFKTFFVKTTVDETCEAT